jgi:NAD-dependent dihydropyrimidine dehydrogenase PreA subunit
MYRCEGQVLHRRVSSGLHLRRQSHAFIQPDECVDCGACEPVCPVEAIYYEDDVPGPWKDFQKVNSEFFVELGSPGGAAKVGPTNKDHADIVSAPAKSE